MSGAFVVRSRTGIAVLALTGVAAALRFATIGEQSHWYDETITASMLDGSLADVFRGVVDTESTPPLYYVVAWLWTQVVGSDEAQLRSLSALAWVLPAVVFDRATQPSPKASAPMLRPITIAAAAGRSARRSARPSTAHTSSATCPIAAARE